MNQFIFIKIPKFLFDSKLKLKSIDREVYSLLMERYNLFMIKLDSNFINENGELYIIYPDKELQKMINCKHYQLRKSIKLLNDLGLIKVDNDYKMNKYYLNVIEN